MDVVSIPQVGGNQVILDEGEVFPSRTAAMVRAQEYLEVTEMRASDWSNGSLTSIVLRCPSMARAATNTSSKQRGKAGSSAAAAEGSDEEAEGGGASVTVKDYVRSHIAKASSASEEVNRVRASNGLQFTKCESAQAANLRLVHTAVANKTVCPWVVAGQALSAAEVASGKLRRGRGLKVAQQTLTTDALVAIGSTLPPELSMASVDGGGDGTAHGDAGAGDASAAAVTGSRSEPIDLDVVSVAPLRLGIPKTQVKEDTARAAASSQEGIQSESLQPDVRPVGGAAGEAEGVAGALPTRGGPLKGSSGAQPGGFAWTQLHLCHVGCCYAEGAATDAADERRSLPGGDTRSARELSAYSKATLVALCVHALERGTQHRAAPKVLDSDVERALARYVSRANAADPSWLARCRAIKASVIAEMQPVVVVARSLADSMLDKRSVAALQQPNSPERLEVLQAYVECLEDCGHSAEVLYGSRQQVIDCFILQQRTEWYKENRGCATKTPFDPDEFTRLIASVLPPEARTPTYTFGAQWCAGYMCQNAGAFMPFTAYDAGHFKRPATGVLIASVGRDAGGCLHLELLSHVARGAENTYWCTQHRQFRSANLSGCDPPGHRTLVDGGTSLDASIDAVPGGTRKARCFSHRQRAGNRNPRVMDAAAMALFKELVWCLEHGGRTVQGRLEELRRRNPAAHAWITSVPADEQFQSAADDPATGLGALQGITTSNWAEIVMKVLLMVRSIPDVLQQLQIMVNWAATRHAHILAKIAELYRSDPTGSTLTPYALGEVTPIWQRSLHLAVTVINNSNSSCVVASRSRPGATYRVHLRATSRRKVCECKKMLTQVWPCHHAFRAGVVLDGWNFTAVLEAWGAPCTARHWRAQMGEAPFGVPTSAQLATKIAFRRVNGTTTTRPMAPVIPTKKGRPVRAAPLRTKPAPVVAHGSALRCFPHGVAVVHTGCATCCRTGLE